MEAVEGVEIRRLLQHYLRGRPKEEQAEFLSWINKEFEGEGGNEQWWLDLNENLFACLRGDFEEMYAGGKNTSLLVEEEERPIRIAAGAQTTQTRPEVPPPKARRSCFGFWCGASSTTDVKIPPPSPKNSSSSKKSKEKKREKQAIPSIDPKRVEVLVESLLKDANFGSGASGTLYGIETQIYQLAITTVLSSILQNVYAIDGTVIFGFEVELEASKERGEEKDQIFETSVPPLVISRPPISALVVELLKDEDINLSIIPDQIEVTLYENTILLVLACLQVFFSKNAMRFFGHEIKTSITPLQGKELSGVLVQRLAAAARGAGPDRLSNDKMEEQIDALLTMAVGNAGHTWADSFTLRPLAKSLIRLVHRLGAEFMRDLRVRVPGSVIAFAFTRKDD